MTTWYEPDEIVDEEAGERRQPEFAPPVVIEEPVTEGSSAVDGADDLLAASALSVAIVDTIPQPPEHSH